MPAGNRPGYFYDGYGRYFWWGVNMARLLGMDGNDELLTESRLVVELRFSASRFADARETGRTLSTLWQAVGV